MSLLQIGVFVDYVPSWLGPTLLLLGLGVMVGLFWLMAISGVRDDGENSIDYDPEKRVGLFLGLLGAGIILLDTYQANTFLFAALALLAGRWVEGVAATRFISTISDFFSDSKSEGNVITNYAKKRAYRFGGVLLFLFLAFWVVIYGLILGFGAGKPALQLAFGWTIVVGTVSLFGLMWKFRDLYRFGAARVSGEIAPQSMSVWVVFVMINCLIVAVVGAQIYNFQLITLRATIEGVEIGPSALELLVPILGNIVYVVGFIVGAKKQW